MRRPSSRTRWLSTVCGETHALWVSTTKSSGAHSTSHGKSSSSQSPSRLASDCEDAGSASDLASLRIHLHLIAILFFTHYVKCMIMDLSFLASFIPTALFLLIYNIGNPMHALYSLFGWVLRKYTRDRLVIRWKHEELVGILTVISKIRSHEISVQVMNMCTGLRSSKCTMCVKAMSIAPRLAPLPLPIISAFQVFRASLAAPRESVEDLL